MIAIVDYGAGNLRSVESLKAQFESHLTSDPEAVVKAEGNLAGC